MSVLRRPQVPITNPSGKDDDYSVLERYPMDEAVVQWKLSCAAVRAGMDRAGLSDALHGLGLHS